MKERAWAQGACRVCLSGRGSTVLWLMGAEEPPRNIPEDTAVLAVSGQDWNRDFSPWPAPAVFRGQPFSGGADAYLADLTGGWMDGALSFFGLTPAREGILGYSLAGLFSLYALYRTDRFSLCGSVSGSLWFDGFTQWALERQPKARPERIFLSIGDREKQARNPRLAQGEDCVRAVAGHLSALCPATRLTLHKGGHFDQPDERLKDAIWYLAGHDGPA